MHSGELENLMRDYRLTKIATETESEEDGRSVVATATTRKIRALMESVSVAPRCMKMRGGGDVDRGGSDRVALR